MEYRVRQCHADDSHVSAGQTQPNSILRTKQTFAINKFTKKNELSTSETPVDARSSGKRAPNDVPNDALAARELIVINYR